MKTAVRFHRVWGSADPLSNMFRNLASAYLDEIGADSLEEGSVEDVLSYQDEPERWLMLAIGAGRVIGFVHGKIDHERRPGMGYLIEFYVVPEYRNHHVGHIMSEAMCAILRRAGAAWVWLSSVVKAEHFWEKQGFIDSGLVEWGEKVMLRPLAKERSRATSLELARAAEGVRSVIPPAAIRRPRHVKTRSL